MTEISASLVKELRDLTGAGMMDSKRALQETQGDIEAARTLLRERGMAAAGKRAGRETTEGVVLATVSGNLGAIAAVGCETEPVARNDSFIRFAERVLETIEERGADAVSELEDERLELGSRLRENVVILGGTRMEAGKGELLADYIHPPGKIGVLVHVRGENPLAARHLAMHISFANPSWTRREDIPEEIVAAERQIYLNSDEVQSKPEQAREKIVEGMLAKRFFAASPGGVLLDQNWIIDTSGKTGVAQALREAGIDVVEHARYAVAG
jgi:elongation factor Ts